MRCGLGLRLRTVGGSAHGFDKLTTNGIKEIKGTGIY